MKVHRIATRSLALFAVLGLCGCAALPKLSWLHRDKTPEIRAASSISQDQLVVHTPVERLYPAAANELRARRYGRAIEILQVARDAAPSDVRVLNALGVAYDKLGRFDLSKRYYELALQSDPTSPVVLANISYSARLQGRAAELASAKTQTPPPAMAAARQPAKTAPARPAVMQLAVASASIAKVQPLLIGSDLTIVDGSGRAGTAERVRVQLAARGWSVAPSVQVERARWANSEIRFPAQHRAAATALARTLRFPTRLAVCSNSCTGLSLTIGADARWIG